MGYGASPLGQEPASYAASPAQDTVTYSAGVGYAAPQTYGQETVTYGATPVGQETLTYAASPAQDPVSFSAGVGYAAPQTLTYAAPQPMYAQGELGVQPATVSTEQQPLSFTDANELFDRIDLNNDGVITRSEFTALVAGAMYAQKA